MIYGKLTFTKKRSRSVANDGPTNINKEALTKYNTKTVQISLV